MNTLLRRVTLILVAPALLFTTQCTGSADTATGPSPSSSTPAPKVVPTGVQVGVAGNAAAILAPGQTLQFWALASYSDGTTGDVTNAALWQSSDPAVATISSTGLLRAAAEGPLDVKASYQSQSGALQAEVRRAGCDASTLSPARLTVGAFGNSNSVTVTTPQSDCRWTARSDASWLPFSYDPGRSGTGSFSYSVPGNSTPDIRSANIVVSFKSGGEIVHSVTQERPVSCSYVVSPADLYFTAKGGTGFFDVTTTPGDCQWNASTSYYYYNVTVTGGASGKGAGRVTYSVGTNTGGYDKTATIQVAGLSGANPQGVHTIHIAK